MKKILALPGLLTVFIGLKANNISVTNVYLTRNATTHTGQVTFNVAWENSWRTSTNESNYDLEYLVGFNFAMQAPVFYGH